MSQAGDQTSTFTVDDQGDPEAVIPHADAREVSIWQNAGAMTSDYNVYQTRRPNLTAAEAKATITPIRMPAGAPFTFDARPGSFAPNVPCGWVELVPSGGSATFAQKEKQ